MKDNGISTLEMTPLIIQYIMHTKKWWYEKTREKSSAAPREKKTTTVF